VIVSEDADDLEATQPGRSQGPVRRGVLKRNVSLGGEPAGPGVSSDAGGAGHANGDATVNPRLFTFVGGKAGRWSVVEAKAIMGEPLPAVERLDIVNNAVSSVPAGGKWILHGVTSNERYTTRPEKDQLVKEQAALGRPGATHAAFIPIRKSADWWGLTQDERRAIFEDRSLHLKTGLKYLPGVARRLHHCRDLGESEPFDFLTLFDYAKADAAMFDELVAELRATEEWKFVEREIDLRLVRVDDD
jgi:hypothetical protein